MNWPHSPSDIRFMLHCYYSPEPYENVDAPAIQETISKFCNAGLIEPGNLADVFTATSMGKAWVNAICSTPYPQQVWIDRMGNFLDAR